ncbi:MULTISPECIES: DNA polymerase III subunit delta [unclassified Snodgrassella]|uniref:DNA polymerase III subunit delta n=1 Tax=unclassified Snodgrassella TaxID=2625236 RepID=UPI0018DD77A8|nr:MULTISPECIES: DNA polymerase III subunit delta [unclassified Snodgrassella]MBI0158173.1 DNA polymerase III subunit delta [Snodgrassella sp. W6238H11]MBI0160003.1 DNA polymerase III subunit delta [Snodgrassella sp. W6238H14]
MSNLSVQPLSSAYLIHGEEELLRIEALDAIRSAARSQQYNEREVINIETGFDWASLLSSVHSVGLFADKKLLEIHIPSGKPGKEGAAVLQQLAEQLPENTCLLLILPKLERLQTQSKWFSSWAKNAQIFEAKSINQNALPQWIKNRLAAQNLNIDNDALALFAEKVEGNLLAAKQEIDKLALIHPAGHTVTLDDAQTAVANVARFDIFQLSAAWMSGNSERVLRLLEGLALERNEPVLLLWVISEDIRTLIRLLAALKQGKSISEMRQSLRLWGEKQTLAPQAAKRIGIRRLLEALQICAFIDRQIKGAEEGNAWAEIKHLFLSLTI